MNSKQKGDQYEDMVEFIYRVLLRDYGHFTVSRNKRVATRYGKVEIDLFCEGQVGGHRLAIAISCKNHKRKVGAQVLRDFTEALRETKSSKGVIVSKSGFTSDAKKRAREHSIDLRRASKISEASIERFANIPIKVTLHSARAVAPSFRVGPSSPKTIKIEDFLCGMPTEEIIALALQKSAIREISPAPFMQVSSFYETHQFNYEFDVSQAIGNETLWVLDVDGSKHIIKDATIYLALETTSYYKSLSKLEGALILESYDSPETRLVFPANSLPRFIFSQTSQDGAEISVFSPVAEIEAISFDRSGQQSVSIEVIRGV